MLKYPCLVLDHDDTVVRSEETVNYPFFCYILDQFRPGTTITLKEYIEGCYSPGFADMCRQKFGFTEQELLDEYKGWMDYVRTHIPDPYPGIAEVIHRQKAEGGLLCVVSHSSRENITRDYALHFGIQPDDIYGWDLPAHLRKPSSYPLEAIMEKYGLKSSEILVVDDLKPAWEMCRKVNVALAFAEWSKENVPLICREMETLCDFSFHDPRALYRHLFAESPL